MIIRPKDKKNILLSGIFLFILIALTSVSVFLLSKDSSLFSKNIVLHTYVDNVQNLKQGAPVQLKGIKIGTVSAIQFESVDKIKISIGIKQEFLQWIKKSSYISFKTQGVLGDKMLEILGGTNEEESVRDNDILEVRKGSQFDKIINKGEDILVIAGRVLQKIDKVLAGLEGEKISKILENLDKSSARTAQILEKIKLDKTMGDLQKSAKSLEEISTQVKEGPGTLHSLIYDRGLHDDIRTLVGGSNRNKVLKYFIRESIKNSED